MLRYKTTRPIVPLAAERKIIEAAVNDHLKIQLRQYELTDLPHFYRLRTQERVMVNTSKGVIDEDIEASRTWMDRALPPNDKHTFNQAVWVQERGGPWEHIGSMGCHMLTPVAHLGYMIREEWWGKSIVTTAVQAFLQAWWALERTEVELSTDSAKDEHDRRIINLEMIQDGLGSKVVPEILLAEIEQNNIASQKIVEKFGFVYRGSETVVEENGTFVLLDYTLSRPS